MIEKVIADENLHFNHIMILNKNEGLPEHFSNSNVYMIVVKVPVRVKQAMTKRRI